MRRDQNGLQRRRRMSAEQIRLPVIVDGRSYYQSLSESIYQKRMIVRNNKLLICFASVGITSQAIEH
jgi:hypothetical protein